MCFSSSFNKIDFFLLVRWKLFEKKSFRFCFSRKLVRWHYLVSTIHIPIMIGFAETKRYYNCVLRVLLIQTVWKMYIFWGKQNRTKQQQQRKKSFRKLCAIIMCVVIKLINKYNMENCTIRTIWKAAEAPEPVSFTYKHVCASEWDRRRESGKKIDI